MRRLITAAAALLVAAGDRPLVTFDGAQLRGRLAGYGGTVRSR